MKITLDYGKTGLPVTLPEDRLLAPPLAIRPANPLPNSEAARREVVPSPILPVRNRVRGTG